MLTSLLSISSTHPGVRNDTCPLCNNGLFEQRSVLLANCQHRYHEKCITHQLDQRNKSELAKIPCAICQTPVLPMVRETGAKFYEPSPYCEALPLQACRSGNHDKLAQILQQDPEIASECFVSPIINGKAPLLLIAAENSDIAGLKLLLDYGADVNARDTNNNSALHMVAEGCNPGASQSVESPGPETLNDNGKTITAIKAAVGKNPMICLQILLDKGAEIDAVNNNGWTPLHLATRQQGLEFMQRLLDQKADINAAAAMGITPLHIAAKYCWSRGIEFLLHNGAEVDATGQTGLTALHRCSGHVQCLQLLLNSHADPNARDIHHWTPLHYAAGSENSLPCIEILLSKGAQIDSSDESGRTPLHIASEMGHSHIVHYLAQKKAEVNWRRNDSWLPLHIAARHGRHQCMEVLHHHGARLDSTISDEISRYSHLTPLHIAAGHESLESATFLIKQGVDINARAAAGETPLHFAAMGGCDRVMHLLIISGADINAREHQGKTPIHLAALAGKEQCLLILTSLANIDINVRSADGQTPLHFAGKIGHNTCMKILIDHNADINATTDEGYTLLHILAQHGHIDCLNTVFNLPNFEPDSMQCQDQYGMTPLQHAVQLNNPQCLEELLKAGASTNYRSAHGCTPLHIAAMENYEIILSTLLCFGADLNAQNDNGLTPMHLAAAAGNAACLEILLDNGGRVDTVDNFARTPMQIAQAEGHTECIEVIARAQSKRDRLDGSDSISNDSDDTAYTPND
ncbi:ankyrin repeat domain-containing protein [Endozoicomonas sp. ONNA2]|uniref:ankyrin repeat domain-containing protein n=1 Tax=Endozoicomonas sp. ONNA2 TaxID=2828741 RepID=UPI0021481713|nr:ankyrin repeat domain-containing protein [Endozoicomonas sp. ONNA2]